MSATLRIETAHNVPFVVRIVNCGESYGANFCLTYTPTEPGESYRVGDPLVEFYDARYPHTEYGQFVIRYYRSTLLEGACASLCLHGGVPEWRVEAQQMQHVRQWLLSR